MIRGDREGHLKEARGKELFPIRGEENVVKLDERRRVTLVTPGEATTVERQFPEVQLINQSTEAAHHTVIEIQVVLILGVEDEVEFTSNCPRT